jgi:16S rRNA processing protein RimM
LDLFVSIAQIAKTRGTRGEVAADVLTDFPRRFASVQRVRVFVKGRAFDEELESYWFHGGRIILKFRGRDTPEAVRELVGGYVQVPEEERYPLPRNTYYHSDLIGCSVEERGAVLGTVTGIFETGGDSVNLVITTAAGHEAMIPLVRYFVEAVDVAGKVITVKTLPGLI